MKERGYSCGKEAPWFLVVGEVGWRFGLGPEEAKFTHPPRLNERYELPVAVTTPPRAAPSCSTPSPKLNGSKAMANWLTKMGGKSGW